MVSAISPIELECVVIGGGVIGLAIARELSLEGRHVVVLEAEDTVGAVTSSRNSEVIHAGLYYPRESLKAELCVLGKAQMYEYCERHHVPHRRCGKLVVASCASELSYLERLLVQASANGVEDCFIVDDKKLRQIEPQISGFAALVSPSTGIVDSHALMSSYVAEIEECGSHVVTRTPVLGGELIGDRIRLLLGGRDTTDVVANLVVNAAGLGAWSVSGSINGLEHRNIPQRHLAKGTYFSFGGRSPSKMLVYPVPEAGGLGVHLTLDMNGQARFGPDVEWVEAIDYKVDPTRSGAFYSAIRKYWPGLPDGSLQPAYSGIRPKIVGFEGGGGGDFCIQGPNQTGHPGYIALYGLESPGLTASLAIARKVNELLDT
ncbi:NAD(P)/FAD-dependent oxidoreductase [Rhizobium sp. LEGMi135b]